MLFQTRKTSVHLQNTNEDIFDAFWELSVWRSWHRTAYSVCVQWILSKMALRWCGGDALLNKIIIVVFFAYKKYSRSLVILRLNVTWIIFPISFLDVDRVNYIAVHGGSESSQNASKNLNLCSEDERRSYGFGMTWGWVINDIIFILGWSNPLRMEKTFTELFI